MNIWQILFGSVTIAATLRMATPLVLGAIGGSFNFTTGVWNIAYEAMMLMGAFFAALGSYLTGSPTFGVFCAVLSGLLVALVFGVLVYHLNADAWIVSLAINMGAWAITTLLMIRIFGARGTFSSDRIVSFEKLHFKLLEGNEFLNYVFNDKIWMVYFTFVIIVIAWIVMYKTPFGLRVRSVGISPTSAQTTGISVLKYRWNTLLIMGVFVSMAGAYLPLSGLSMFTENMTAGRGALCLAAVIVGKDNPIKTTLLALLFAYSFALQLSLTSLDVPTQLVLTIPYFAVVLVLFAAGVKNFAKKRYAKHS